MNRCHLIGHQPGPDPIWKDGEYRTRCTRCGRGMRQCDGKWRIAPRDYRVQWQRRPSLDGPGASAKSVSAWVEDDRHTDTGPKYRAPRAPSLRPLRRGNGWVAIPAKPVSEEGGDERAIMEQAIAAFRVLLLR